MKNIEIIKELSDDIATYGIREVRFIALDESNEMIFDQLDVDSHFANCDIVVDKDWSDGRDMTFLQWLKSKINKL